MSHIAILALARTFHFILANRASTWVDRTSGSDTSVEPPVGPVRPIRADLAAAAFLLAKTFLSADGLMARLAANDGVVSLVVNDAHLAGCVAQVVEACIFQKFRDDDPQDTLLLVRPTAPFTHEAVIEALNVGRPVVGIATEAGRLPETLVRAADHRLELVPLDADAIAFAIGATTGEPPSRSVSPAAVARLSPQDLSMAIRLGWTADQCISRIEVAVQADTDPANASKRHAIQIEDLHGFGQAKAWALNVVDDIRLYRGGQIAWDDLDSFGLLLSSPPGCGKTEFAAAVARAAQIPIVSTSVAQWNSAPHLGGTLKAIKADFAKARSCAPCVLFIDELDGIGDRSKLSGEYVDYWTQIVNLVLEELTRDNTGVIVLAATNHPDRIDPAIRRSGRLDRHIAIDRPTQEDLPHIFRSHLGNLLPGGDLTTLGLIAAGGTGADVASWVKRAKANARRARRPLKLDDLIAAISHSDRPLTAAERWRVAVHEAGHVLAAVRLGVGTVSGASITPRGGSAMLDLPFTGAATAEDVENQIAVILAGRAAETLVLGRAAIGSGMGKGSDMSRATFLACMLETQVGAGQFGLVHTDTATSDIFHHPLLFSAVRDRLAAADRSIATLIHETQATLLELAQTLLAQGYLSKQQILTIVSCESERIET